MKKLFSWMGRHRLLMGILLIGITLGATYYFLYGTKTATTDTFAVVETVARGSVSSGIETSGTIVAAQKLDLDVYKQSRRIEAVNVSNASHVTKGTVLFSFDKSSAFVDVQSSRVDIASAELALATERANVSNANPTLRTLQNSVVTARAAIVQAEKDTEQAEQDFFNANLTVESGNTETKDKVRPTVSGLYSGNAAGVYTVTVYSSGADSGYSYRVSGLETGVVSLINDIPTALGTKGLKIVFPSTTKHGDVWHIAVPNTASPMYGENKEAYEKKLRDLAESITNKKIEIANTEIEIKEQSQTDAVPYRNLDVSKAEATLAQARQKLSQNYDVVHDQDIIAPFAGTVEGLENVVVGASPTGSTNDSISLGTLISDDFLVKFSLSAVDVAKVVVGQKVLVSVTSFPGALPLEASVTEVSSLPESDGVAQYQVQALIAVPASSTLRLREGLLADVEVVQNEVPDVIRVPLSAISYENSQAKVMVVGDLTTAQQTELDSLGVIKSVAGTFPSYAVDVTVGVTGTFYAEIKSGLTEGMKIIVTNTEADTAVIDQANFGPPDRNEERSGNSAPAE